MKSKILILVLCMSGLSQVWAQEQEESVRSKLNALKFSLTSLLGGKFAFEYERLLSNHIAAGITYSIRPESGIPARSRVMDYLEGEEEVLKLISGFKSSSTSVTPEVRFYTSNRGNGRGFYLAPYVKFTKFDFSTPYEFDVDISDYDYTYYTRQEIIPLKGDLSTVTAGMSLGFNFKLTNSLFLDWRLIGPGYGNSKGNVYGTMNLDANEQEGLRMGLEELKSELEDLPVKVKMEYLVNGDGAEINIQKSPWASIRSGLSISYKF